MTINYEWDCETLDDDGDIEDHDFCERYQDLTIIEPCDICLVRNVEDESGMVGERQWAYVKDGKLPSHFDGGAKVPARFHKEIA